jgi:hypothetical protein
VLFDAFRGPSALDVRFEHRGVHVGFFTAPPRTTQPHRHRSIRHKAFLAAMRCIEVLRDGVLPCAESEVAMPRFAEQRCRVRRDASSTTPALDQSQVKPGRFT